MPEKIYHIKLKNGKDIVGILKSLLKNQIILEKPVELEYQDGTIYSSPYGFIFGESKLVHFNLNQTNACSPANKGTTSIYHSLFSEDEDEESGLIDYTTTDENDSEDRLSVDNILQYSKYYN